MGAGTGTVTAGGDRAALIADAYARIRAHRYYPELARRRGVEGRVVLSFTVAPDGTPRDVRVMAGADPALEQAARQAVRAATPLPRLAGTVEVQLDFRLQDR